MSPESGGRPALPTWAETLRQKYLAGEASVFVLYRNVFDRYRVGERYYTLLPFLSEVLLKDNKQRIFELSIDRGVRVIQGGGIDEKAELYRHLEGKGLAGIFESLERQMLEQRSSALLIPYAGTIFPAAEPHFLSLDERGAFTALHRWSLDEEFRRPRQRRHPGQRIAGRSQSGTADASARAGHRGADAGPRRRATRRSVTTHRHADRAKPSNWPTRPPACA